MRKSGAIKNWNPAKGFGFVKPEKNGNDVFIHISDFIDRNNAPEIGQRVTYFLSKDSKRRVCGKEVKRKNDVIPKKPSNFGARLSLILATLFTLAVVYSADQKLLPMQVAWFLLGINILTFVMYAWDKMAAINGRHRTSENSLHLVALLGGWPGAALAQQVIRHKSKKAEFRLVFWLTLLINIACFCWLFTKPGISFLDNLLVIIKAVISNLLY